MLMKLDVFQTKKYLENYTTLMTFYIYILGHLADAFVQSDLQYFIQTFTDGSGCHAVWGSVSCPRTVQHADQGN